MADGNPINFAKLIPELALWNNGAGISPESWIGCVGTLELAIGYSRLFWPEFVEHETCVFLEFSLDSYRGFMEACGGDRERVEAVMNHRHLAGYFSHAGGSATDEQLVYLGRVLKEMWRSKLARDFPGRSFVVSFPEGPFEDLGDYEVTFWQAAE